MLRNSSHSFGLLTISLHWLMAVVIVGLFCLGLYMTDLTYYDRFYKLAPWIHKSVGVLLFFALIGRWIWHRFSPPPALLPAARWEQRIAKLTHKIFYLLIIAVAFSGYLISTAKGQGIDVFNWFTLPALPPLLPDQEDLAGEIHEILTYLLILLAAAHAGAALKHHFWNKDATLKRMLGQKLAP